MHAICGAVAGMSGGGEAAFAGKAVQQSAGRDAIGLTAGYWRDSQVDAEVCISLAMQA